MSDQNNLPPVSLSIVEEARRLRGGGYGIVWIEAGEKRPTRPEWSLKSQEPEDYRPGCNLGVMTGRISGDLVCVDLDGDRARELAPKYLPTTQAVEGRPSKPRAHWWYVVTDVPPEISSDAAGGMGGPWTRRNPEAGIDFLGTGAQAVVPPSLHPSGEARAWEGEFAPATAPFLVLWEAVQKLAAACGHSFPEKGPTAQGPTGDGTRKAKRTPGKDRKDRVRLAMGYVRTMPEAVEGHGGDKATYTVACRLVEGFGLTPQEAYPVLEWFNEHKCRPKWEPDDLWHKLERADLSCTEERGALYRRGKGEAPSALVIEELSEVTPERVEWLWEPWIPRGKFTLVEGDPGVNKSTLLMDLAARVSRGLPMPNTSAPVEPGHVLLGILEDDLAATVVNRLRAAGADLSRISNVNRVRGDDGEERPLTIPDDLPMIQGLIEARGSRLVILDPLHGFQDESLDSNSDKVRPMLLALVKMAQETGAAVVGVRHLRKGATDKAVYKGAGSIAYLATARSVLLVVHPKGGGKNDRVLAHSKSNLGPKAKSLSFTVESFDVDGDEHPRVEWGEEVDVSADDLTGEGGPTGGKASKLERAKAELQRITGEGFFDTVDIPALCKAIGVGSRTIEDAKKDLGLAQVYVSCSGGGRRSLWYDRTKFSPDDLQDRRTAEPHPPEKVCGPAPPQGAAPV